jgi:hypothetical protein
MIADPTKHVTLKPSFGSLHLPPGWLLFSQSEAIKLFTCIKKKKKKETKPIVHQHNILEQCWGHLSKNYGQ